MSCDIVVSDLYYSLIVYGVQLGIGGLTNFSRRIEGGVIQNYERKIMFQGKFQGRTMPHPPPPPTHTLSHTHTHFYFAADILKFDNSYSWARSKEVFYTVKLLPPGERPHLHVPPGEMEKAGGGGGGHTPNSSPSSTRSSEFYDCDITEAELEIHPPDSAQVDITETAGEETNGASATST